MVLKANDKRTSSHDEFRGPRSDYVRQVALETTESSALEQVVAIRSNMAAECANLVSIQTKLVEVYSQEPMSGGSHRTVTCMVLKANDKRTSSHDEFRGPRSDYVRQVALETTESSALEQVVAIRSNMAAECANLVSIQTKLVEVYSQEPMSGGSHRTVTCMVLKANDKRTSSHDEFRGPRSDYVRQVALETTGSHSPRLCFY
ncbi:hypothetical protein TNCV_1468851 [Trichonephila clavipes]|nr:hypothetical protein TNCV_1468851 [Trichonephila clavipes]